MLAGIRSNPPYFTRAFLISLSLFLSSGLLAQDKDKDKEKPKLKDFGSSLKRIKSDAEKKVAVEVNSKSGSKSDSNDIEVVKVETSLVSNDVLVLDAKGNFVTGLTEKDFVVMEDGQPQQVGMFSLGNSTRVSRSIVLVIDYSGSMTPYLKMSIAAAKVLIDQLQPQDRMAVVTDDVKLLVGFTHDKNLLKSKLDSLKSKARDPAAKSGWFRGHSLQFSALMATLLELFDGEDERPIVIFQTDGDQFFFLHNSPPMPVDPQIANIRQNLEGSTRKREFDRNMAEGRKRNQAYVNFSLDDIYRAAEKVRATIYTVIPGHQLLGRPPAEQLALTRAALDAHLKGVPNSSPTFRQRAGLSDEDLRSRADNVVTTQGALAALSTSTGGWTMFLQKPDDADHIYSSILADINRRYIVGYYPTNKERDGKRRKLDVTVRNHPDYVVLGRRWYYAPTPEQ